MSKKVVILNGPPNSGKDVGAKFIVDNQEILGLGDCYHLEFKKTLFELTRRFYNIRERDWDQLYTREGKETPNDHFEVGFWDALSPREALIHVSEKVIKPVFGPRAFGVAACNELKQGINIFSDGGFNEELIPIINEVGIQNILVIHLIRKDCSFENDSRSYLDVDKLGVKYFVVENNGTEEEYTSSLVELIKEWSLKNEDSL